MATDRKPPLAEPVRSALVRILVASIRCPVCGRRKALKQCFCRTCYFALPQILRLKLYTKLSEGNGEFEQRFFEALMFLFSRGLSPLFMEFLKSSGGDIAG